ncbi:unnamed protein product [Merluccius merluccius]
MNVLFASDLAFTRPNLAGAAGLGEQLTVDPGGEAAGSLDPLRASANKEGRDRGGGTDHLSRSPVPGRQRQGPANVERHKGEVPLHIHRGRDAPTQPSASPDSRHAYPGGGGVFTEGVALTCGRGMPAGKEAAFSVHNDLN